MKALAPGCQGRSQPLDRSQPFPAPVASLWNKANFPSHHVCVFIDFWAVSSWTPLSATWKVWWSAIKTCPVAWRKLRAKCKGADLEGRGGAEAGGQFPSFIMLSRARRETWPYSPTGACSLTRGINTTSNSKITGSPHTLAGSALKGNVMPGLISIRNPSSGQTGALCSAVFSPLCDASSLAALHTRLGPSPWCSGPFRVYYSSM